MARTWYAGSRTAPRVPPSRNGNQAQPSQSVSGGNKFTVNDTTSSSSSPSSSAAPTAATAEHQTSPTKTVHSESDSDPDSDGSIAWVTPLTSPLREANTQPTQHPKPKNPPTAVTSESQGAMTSNLVRTMINPFAPSSSTPGSESAPRRAPIAQMVPLPPNAAVTTAAPAVTNLGGPPNSHHYPGDGIYPNTISIVDPRAFFPTTASTISLAAPILASTPTVPKKECARQRSASKVTLTPAPITALSAFNDATLASHVQDVKVRAPARQQQTSGVTKRKNVKKSPRPKSTGTPEGVAAEKRGRGRPRNRAEVQQPLLQQDGEYRPKEQLRKQAKQHQPALQIPTPVPQTYSPNPFTPFQSTPSAFPRQQQRAIAVDTDGAVCAEEPRRWPERGDYVASLQTFDSKPEPIHSDPVHFCANHAAHENPLQPLGHAVCTSCRNAANRHILVARPGLASSAWWPLCETCGEDERLRLKPAREGCSCCRKWLCFWCQTEEVEIRCAKNRVEAECKRRTIVRGGMDGDDPTVELGWACDCGRTIGPNATLLRCAGCQGLKYGRFDQQEAVSREENLRKAALAWT